MEAQNNGFKIQQLLTASSQSNDCSIINLNESQTLMNKAKNSTPKRRPQKPNFLNYVQEMIDFQEILHALGSETPQSAIIRQDFLEGQRGAMRLSPFDLNDLINFHCLITACRQPQSVTEFNMDVKDPARVKATEHFKFLMEGSHSRIEGLSRSYFEGKQLLRRLSRSNYFIQRRMNIEINMNRGKPENKPSYVKDCITLDEPKVNEVQFKLQQVIQLE